MPVAAPGVPSAPAVTILTRYVPTIPGLTPALDGGVRNTDPHSNSRSPPGRSPFGCAGAVTVTNAAWAGGTGRRASAIDAPSRSASGDRIEIEAVLPRAPGRRGR